MHCTRRIPTTCGMQVSVPSNRRAIALRVIAAIVMLILFLIAAVPVAWAQEITATLRIEHLEDTRMAPTEITFEHRPWGEYGIPGITNPDPGFITPIHVLAEAFEQTYGSGAAADRIVANNFGIVSIDGRAASIEDASNVWWMWAANQTMPEQFPGWGHTLVTYPVQDGDYIDILGSWGGTWPSDPGWLAFFDSASYRVTAGQSFDVRLRGLDGFNDFGAASMTDLAGAEILIDPIGGNRVGATTSSTPAITTNAQGMATLSFDAPGTYLLSAKRYAAASPAGISDISRPFATITVVEVPRWDSFRGNAFNSAVVDASTPRPPQVARAVWTRTVGSADDALSPVKIGDYIYIAGGSTLWKLDRANQVQETRQLATSVGRTGYLAAGSGRIFVPLSTGAVQAFDADTLTPIWTSGTSNFQSDWTSVGALTYADGYLYGAAGDLTLMDSEGMFFCLDVSDGSQVWTHSSTSSAAETGFLWAGAAITDDVAIFAGDDGILVSRAAGSQAGGIVDTAILPGGVRSSVLYVEGSSGAGVAYVATTNGHVARVAVAANGSLGSVIDEELSGARSTSTPVMYDNRLYVVSGEQFDSGYVDVFDATTLELLRSVQLSSYSQSSPVLSTAGANTQNGYQVNLYIALNGPHDDVIRVTDAEPTGSAVAAASNSGITATVIFSPGGSSALNSLTADDSGRLYYVDGQGRFTALEATNAPPQNGGGN
ncbi:MAG: hypothetical protein FWC81_02275, partial [Coriobacteriia bacterium]|nr:hypothetical protein [Coriobacteriia bacterium]